MYYQLKALGKTCLFENISDVLIDIEYIMDSEYNCKIEITKISEDFPENIPEFEGW